MGHYAPDGGGTGGSGGAMSRLFDSSADTLKISWDDPKLVIEDAKGRSRTIYTDGRTVTRETRRGEMESKCVWKSDRVLESKTTGPMESKQTWKLSEDGESLEVKFKASGRRSFSIKRVYDRVIPADEEAPSADVSAAAP